MPENGAQSAMQGAESNQRGAREAPMCEARVVCCEPPHERGEEGDPDGPALTQEDLEAVDIAVQEHLEVRALDPARALVILGAQWIIYIRIYLLAFLWSAEFLSGAQKKRNYIGRTEAWRINPSGIPASSRHVLPM